MGPPAGKRPQDWTAAEKLDAVLEAASLSEEELGEYLRRKGLHSVQLEQWRCRVTEAAMEALQSKSSRKKASIEAKRVKKLERELRRKEKALAETAALLVPKKSGGDLGGRGRLHGVEEREMILSLVDEAVDSGARLRSACHELGLSVKTIQRWRKPGGGKDLRHGPRTVPANKLSVEERQEILKTVNSPEFRDLSPNQIVPRLADQEIYLGSESTMYRLLKEVDQLRHREPSKPAKRRRPDEHEATGPNEVWSWGTSRTSVVRCGEAPPCISARSREQPGAVVRSNPKLGASINRYSQSKTNNNRTSCTGSSRVTNLFRGNNLDIHRDETCYAH